MRSIIIIWCLFLTSCRHKPIRYNDYNNQINEAFDNEQEKLLDFIIQQEAMLVDVPIPLYDERIIFPFDKLESNTLAFGYKSPLSRVQAREFFMNQMERLGWQHLVSFETSELLLQFSSPNRYCTVVIKNADINSVSSHIFIYLKNNN